ncbi:hypothetical protein LINGRAHAP2_LOCUS18494, partial [Linum grandiflorum]
RGSFGHSSHAPPRDSCAGCSSSISSSLSVRKRVRAPREYSEYYGDYWDDRGYSSYDYILYSYGSLSDHC